MFRKLFAVLSLAIISVPPASGQRYVSIELPLHFSYNLILVPKDFKTDLATKGGPGVAGGLGVKVNALSYLVLRTGIELWNKKLRSEFNALFTDPSGRVFPVMVSEDGHFRYAGLYVSLLFERKQFFIGGGFRFSVMSS